MYQCPKRFLYLVIIVLDLFRIWCLVLVIFQREALVGKGETSEVRAHSRLW